MSVSKIAGIRPQDIGLKVLRDSARPILPATRDRSLIIPGRNGAWDFGADFEPRQIDLDCAFITRSPVELQNHVDALATLLVDGYGKPRTVDLSFAAHPERNYYVRYSGSLPIDRLIGLGRFTLPLVAFDPVSYLHEQDLDSDIILDSDIRLNGEEYILYQVNSAQSIVVPNIGNLISRPTITVTGSFSTLSISTNGKVCQFTEAVSNKTLIINGESFTVRLSGVNKLGKMSGDFIELLPGDNAVTISGTDLACDITFETFPKFL